MRRLALSCVQLRSEPRSPSLFGLPTNIPAQAWCFIEVTEFSVVDPAVAKAVAHVCVLHCSRVQSADGTHFLFPPPCSVSKSINRNPPANSLRTSSETVTKSFHVSRFKLVGFVFRISYIEKRALHDE